MRLSPCVAGYVGGDITAGLLSCGRLLEGRSLFVDVGTNGEMALRCGDGFLCCAVATGPAFEGGGISCGMAGLPGAVRRMSWDGAGPVLEMIGGGQPRGLCGSGLLDALALLLELGAVDQSGRLLPPDGAARACPLAGAGPKRQRRLFLYAGPLPLSHGGRPARAAACQGRGGGRHRGAAAAGGAVGGRAGRAVSGRRPGQQPQPPKAPCASACSPRSLQAKSPRLAITALAGAGEALLSERARAALFDIARRCTYVELSGDADFSRAFPEHLPFD